MSRTSVHHYCVQVQVFADDSDREPVWETSDLTKTLFQNKTYIILLNFLFGTSFAVLTQQWLTHSESCSNFSFLFFFSLCFLP